MKNIFNYIDMEILALTNHKKTEGNSRLAIPTFEGYEIISANNIIRCEAAGNYTRIFYINPVREFLVSRKLGDFEKLLCKNGFIRVHNSHIINPLFVCKLLKSDGGVFEMYDGFKIRITRSKSEVIQKFFEEVKRL